MPGPRTQQSNFSACSPQPPLNAERLARKPSIPFFKVFWSTRRMNHRSTECETDALTTTLSHWITDVFKAFTDVKVAKRRSLKTSFSTNQKYIAQFCVCLHQSTAASTWWCGPRHRLGWVVMAVGLPEHLSYPGHSPSFFCYAAL